MTEEENTSTSPSPPQSGAQADSPQSIDVETESEVELPPAPSTEAASAEDEEEDEPERIQEEEQQEDDQQQGTYLNQDVLLKHLKRQAYILKDALQEELVLPTTVSELSRAFEKQLFCPPGPPAKQENGTLQPNPRLNFYPTFIVPETLATYHLFFQNQRIPFSCKANRPATNRTYALGRDAHLPNFPSVEDVHTIFEGLGPEEVSKNALQNEQSHLIELEHDSPRVAVMKRNLSITHFAYPALNLPPKVMSVVMENLIRKTTKGCGQLEEGHHEEEEGGEVVSDEELRRWLKLSDVNPDRLQEQIQERRKTVMAAVLVGTTLRSLERFFTKAETIKKIGESLHYLFRQGYIRQACKVSQVELTHLVTYMGILHENRVGQTTLHNSLVGESRLDYVRDTIWLFLVYTWQTAMGVWQQCMDPNNLQELGKILRRDKKKLWTADSEEAMASTLSEIVFPEELLQVLQRGLPDIVNQSMMQQFRDFILERSAILPAMTSALPTDFVPIYFKQCPPQLWPYTYLLQLANFFMYHNDLQQDSSGEGLMECYCRCNLCTPHRSLATNTALLNEVQAIGTFELARPPQEDGTQLPPLKLTPGLWTNAYLRKFEERDYYPFQIRYYEDQKKATTRAELTACVITQPQILAQLQEIKKAREDFLLKKGRGVYLDPQTGEELSESGVGNRQFARKPRHASDEREQRRERNESADSAGMPEWATREAECGDVGVSEQYRRRRRYRQRGRGGALRSRTVTLRRADLPILGEATECHGETGRREEAATLADGTPERTLGSENR